MRISRRKRYQKRIIAPSPGSQYRANDRIRATEVVLIDESGQNLGVMATSAAVALANERELDLVEVSPLAVPPVVKLLDYGAFKYQKEKEARKQKSKQVDTKGIRLSPRIGDHDLGIRIGQAVGFIKEGNKVKLEMVLRGRERQPHFIVRAKEIIAEFVNRVNTEVSVKSESSIEKQENRLTMIIGRS